MHHLTAYTWKCVLLPPYHSSLTSKTSENNYSCPSEHVLTDRQLSLPPETLIQIYYFDDKLVAVLLLFEERCLLPRDPGPCQHSMLRWHYSQEEGRCIVFQYGGCGGNGNRFARKHIVTFTNFISSAGWAIYVSWLKCCLFVCLCVKTVRDTRKTTSIPWAVT